MHDNVFILAGLSGKNIRLQKIMREPRQNQVPIGVATSDHVSKFVFGNN